VKALIKFIKENTLMTVLGLLFMTKGIVIGDDNDFIIGIAFVMWADLRDSISAGKGETE